MPCFALTGPEAGSDAGSIPDYGIVCWGEHEGERVLGMRVTWEKRYITLGPVATLLGLAFRLYDPDGLLGDRKDIGITVALIPTRHPGVNIGRRHLPLDAAFMNGPNSGKDVFIPMDWVVGGQAYAGQGWRMLMECLAAGRSISLPSSATGRSQAGGAHDRRLQPYPQPVPRSDRQVRGCRRGARAHRRQHLRDGGRTRHDRGGGGPRREAFGDLRDRQVPLHRAGRQVVNDAMDVHGGKGICLGPNNYLGRGYQQVPIGITVEGANILTRSMIIFGQGAIRCHPYVLKEIAATQEPDPVVASRAFDEALWGHVGFLAGSKARALWLGLTGARLVSVPGPAELRRHLRQLTRLSAAFAVAADFAMLFLGGDLKRREKISARLGDVLSQLYLGSCVVKRYQDEGAPPTDAPFAQWALDDCVHQAQEAFFGLFENFPVRWAARALRLITFPLGRSYAPPSDRLGHRVAGLDAGSLARARPPDRRHLRAQARGRSRRPSGAGARAGRPRRTRSKRSCAAPTKSGVGGRPHCRGAVGTRR